MITRKFGNPEEKKKEKYNPREISFASVKQRP
jgi:hypothetical protein